MNIGFFVATCVLGRCDTAGERFKNPQGCARTILHRCQVGGREEISGL